MCGIAGIFCFDGRPDYDTLCQINDCQVHRGPDDSGIYTSGPVGLANRRLSIIGLDTGHQPITNEDGSVVTTFNGEIYNYKTLRRSLADEGHRFSTETDTEVLVHLYEEHGISFLEQICGMFSFALWDDEAERLLLARDPMGIKPLYVATTSDRVAFASELPAVLESGIDPGGMDRDALGLYFVFEFIPAPLSAFRNIGKLRSGECALVTENGVTRREYYSPSVEPNTKGLSDAAKTLRRKVETSVQRRLQSDVPLGAFLSGGIDSSIIVGIMTQLAEEPVKTFNVGFRNPLFDESWAAREVADYHDTDHHEYMMSVDDLRELIPEVIDRLGEPFGDASLVPLFVVARETSSEVKVALSGDGGDELFGGYERYRAEYLSRYYRMLPARLRKQVIRPLLDSLPRSRRNRLGELGWKANVFIRGAEGGELDRHLNWLRIIDDRIEDLAVGTSATENAEAELRAQHDGTGEHLPGNCTDFLSRMMAVDSRYKHPYQNLHKTDLASMYNSLEVRVPLMDVGVFEFALSLPRRYKITLRTQKRILKSAFEDVLPESILRRKKQGFEMPVGEWFKSELSDDFRATVGQLDGAVIDPDGVLEVFDEHVRGKQNHERFLWSVFVYGKWAERMRRRGVIARI